MKGIHLNDIPMSLFMEYFNKTNLTPKEFTPKYITPTVYEYEFEIDGVVGTSYFYRSKFEFTTLNAELAEYFSDLDTGAYALIDDTTILDKLYYDSSLHFVTGHQYRFTEDDITWDNFIELNAELSKTVAVEFDMIDNRNQADLILTYLYTSPLTATWDSNYQRWNITDPALVGYIYENELFQIQDTDDDTGKKIYLDEYDRETTEYTLQDPFSLHNSAIREAYSKIIDLDGNNLEFNPEVIGMIDSSISRGKSLAYYEEYTRTKTYRKITTGTVDNYEYIDREIWDKMTETIDKLPDSYRPKPVVSRPINTILNLDALRKIKVSQNEDSDKWVEVNVLAQETAPTGSIIGDYWIDITADADILRIYDGDWTSLQTPRANQTLPPTTGLSDGAYWIDDDNKLYQYKDWSYTAITNTYVSDLRETVLLDIHTIDGDDTIYLNTLFGDSVNINQVSPRSYILEKFTSPTKGVDLDTEEAETTTILKDILDNSIYVEYKEKYIKTIANVSISFSEFLDYTHASVSTSEDFTLDSGTLLTQIEPLTDPIKIESLSANFSYSHYYELGYSIEKLTEIRGNLIDSDVVKEMRLSSIKELSGLFMEKRYDDFLFYDSDMVFSENILTNMRIFTEGYIKGLEKDSSLFELPEVKKDLINYTAISPRIVIGNIQSDVSDINTKTYTESMPYILNKLATETTFTKLLDYEKFPTDASRNIYLAETSKRLKAYNDFSRVTSALDFPEITTRVYTRNLPTKLEFKNFLIYNLFQNFYKYSLYDTHIDSETTLTVVDGNAFTDNYADFYKDKLINIDKNYMTVVTTDYEKLVYRKEDMTVNDLLEKILIDEWSVL